VTPDLDRDGACRLPGAAAAALPAIEAALAGLPEERAGLRLHGRPDLTALLVPEGPIGAVVAQAVGRAMQPVRALLFDKSPGTNWSLGWHQDRTIVVAQRIDTPGYGPWTIKQGLHHVEPPPELQAAMVTLRLHLDPVPADNAPLLVVPGSHRRGRIAEADIAAIVAQGTCHACLAERGDVWL